MPSSTSTRRDHPADTQGAARRRGKKEPMKRDTQRDKGLIVVGVDYSAGSKGALRFALDEAKLRQATLRVVHTCQYGYIGFSGIEGFSPVLGADLSDLRRTAEVALDATLHEVAPDPNGVVDRAPRRRGRTGHGAGRRVPPGRPADRGVAWTRRIRRAVARVGQPTVRPPRGLSSRDRACASRRVGLRSHGRAAQARL